MASPYSYISLDGIEMNGVVIDSTGTVTISIKNESDYRQPYQYTVTDNQKWIPQMTGIDTIDAQGQIDIQLDYNFSHGGRYTPYSQINVVVIPVKHPYAIKQKEFIIFDKSNLPLDRYPRQSLIDHVDNIPNPFNPATNIKYELLVRGKVEIIIYDIMGREIRSLVSGHQDAGFRIVNWDATNDYGQAISAGMYIYVIQAGDFRMTKKMVLLK